LSPDILAIEGFLTETELGDLEAAMEAGPCNKESARVDFGQVEEKKLPLLKKAARRFIDENTAAGAGHGAAADFLRCCEREAYWLDDYAVFQVLCDRYRDARWHTVWDASLARREKAALERVREEKAEGRCGPRAEILEWKVLQYFFEKQWQDLKAYVNNKGIRIIGDIPIFVAPDSADSWTHIQFFRTGPDGKYSLVSGVPPDYFSPTGQLWGNPVYDWEKMKRNGYDWWKARIRRLLTQVDMFRIDHFRGFDAYWAVPAENSTAENGTWEAGPGADFFESLKADLGELPVLAEDLGFLTEGVKKLRDGQGFPGMKVCQFGFEAIKDGILDARHLFLPHNYSYPWAAYTGTHDNDTTAGWYSALAAADRQTVAAYLNCGPAGPARSTVPVEPADIAWAMIRAVMASHAEYAVFPLQDLLGLGTEARMNTPATCGGTNWTWRLSRIPPAELAQRFNSLVSLYSRI
jgi:4-alpha-glucanotransferase